ncbi:MAG: hypothetical protein RLZZ502_445 [Pseudomonadota bacterium]|jgi:ADP-ribose pyrophosphatase
MSVPLIETRLSSEKILSGHFLQVYRDTVVLPDNTTATREYIDHPGAVMILPVLSDGRLLMERQFRYPIGRVMWEFPAGKIDPHEQQDPLATAKRELAEETGYTASYWQHFHTHHPLIAYANERIECYLATGLTAGAAHPDAGEFLEVLCVPPAECEAAILDGRITDGKTCATYFIAKAKGLL